MDLALRESLQAFLDFLVRGEDIFSRLGSVYCGGLMYLPCRCIDKQSGSCHVDLRN